MGKFAADVETIRRRARLHMERGALTEGYRANVDEVIRVLNDALATEIVCILRYKRHYFTASGIDAQPVAAEFLQHANEEQQHADWIALRITQLGGEPNFNPEGLSERSHSEYTEGETLVEMIKENLVAERIAIESYSEIIRWLGNDDPTSRRMMEDILKMEEEHANDLATLLETMAADKKPRSAASRRGKAPAPSREARRRATGSRHSDGSRRGGAGSRRVPLAEVVVAAALFGLSSACANERSGDRTKAESEKTMETQSTASDTGPTGALSEDAFKALHQLRTDAAPAPRGSMIEVAGERAYLSLPEGATPPIPGVVVIQEWWGLNDHIKHWSDRLAADGYAAVAVDLYGGKVADNPDSAMASMKAVDPTRAVEILRAAHAFLAADPRIRAARRGSIGWCFGGGQSLQLALHAPDLNAAVIYYGHPVTDPKPLAAIKAAILGIFGNRDQSIPPGMVNEFEAALKAAGVEHEIARYDADHAFANPSGAHYDQPNAAAAWEKTRAFLAKHLKQ